jgi:hypothetical protein
MQRMVLGNEEVKTESEWEKYIGGPAETTLNRLHATINKKRKILLNANLYRKCNRPAAVFLSYNRRRNLIAIERADPNSTDAFPVRTNRNCYEIMASSFCRHFGIKIDSTLKFLRPKFDDDRRLLLNLNDTTIVSRLDRKPSQNHER